jgi:hypothetical protein
MAAVHRPGDAARRDQRCEARHDLAPMLVFLALAALAVLIDILRRGQLPRLRPGTRR